MQDSELLRFSADIVSAHVSHNAVPAGSVPDLILSVYQALGQAVAPTPDLVAQEPAVPIKKSVFPAYLICLEDGRKLKMLKRHLQTSYGLTPDAYRTRWGLPESYPMVAPDYAAKRSALAKESGLGRVPAASTPVEPMAEPEPAMPEIAVRKFPAKTRGRKPSAKNSKQEEIEAADE